MLLDATTIAALVTTIVTMVVGIAEAPVVVAEVDTLLRHNPSAQTLSRCGLQSRSIEEVSPVPSPFGVNQVTWP